MANKHSKHTKIQALKIKNTTLQALQNVNTGMVITLPILILPN
jgi:hypothetical protein